MPTARQPRALASWPTALPTAPLAALTTIVWPGLRLDDLHQAVPGGDAGHADRAEVGRQRHAAWCRPCAARPAGRASTTRTAASRPCRRPCRPAGSSGCVDARPPRRRCRRSSPRSSGCGCGVALGVVHAAAHVRVEAEEVVAHQHLAVGGLGRPAPRPGGSWRRWPRPRGARRAWICLLVWSAMAGSSVSRMRSMRWMRLPPAGRPFRYLKVPVAWAQRAGPRRRRTDGLAEGHRRGAVQQPARGRPAGRGRAA